MSLADMLARDGCTADTLHYACFVGMLALSSGTTTVMEILGDHGLIHEIVHWILWPEEEGSVLVEKEELVKMARRIERAIPGYPIDVR